jgi:DNA polymerase-4
MDQQRVFFHADIDAFFAAVEQADNPELKGKPVIIGALPGKRGVVSACSYEARALGVRSAMPISKAYKKCPHGVYLPVRMERYAQMSGVVMDVLQNFTPNLRQISIDEAFLDMTGTEKLFGPPLEAARNLKTRVKRQTGLTISIGIAGNRYLAKIASDFRKPDGLCQIEHGNEEHFMRELPLKALWGLGEKTLARLLDYNITTIGMLQSLSLHTLASMCGKAMGNFLFNACRGIDPGIFREQTKSRSVSSEVTFDLDRKDVEGLKRTVLYLAQEVMFRLIHHNYRAKTVSLKIRTADFVTSAAQVTLKHWINSSEELYEVACTLLKKKWNEKEPVRLVGVGAANIEQGDFLHQPGLFENEENKKNKVEQAVYNIKRKLGKITLTKANLLTHNKNNNNDSI